MIRHLLKLIWNRKQANSLLLLELFLSFLVLAGLGTMLAVVGLPMRQPSSIDYADVWELRLSTNNDTLPQAPVLERLLPQLRAQPGVLGVSVGQFNAPFSPYAMNANLSTDGHPPVVGSEVMAAMLAS